MKVLPDEYTNCSITDIENKLDIGIVYVIKNNKDMFLIQTLDGLYCVFTYQSGELGMMTRIFNGKFVILYEEEREKLWNTYFNEVYMESLL